ncbi:MAG: pentapeptide repeat-containing protein [Candidatus Tectomicrobia bacterium]|nr:pentapeptide repeat-containing protein [Candidatus Tectomicrobia bacterium]
MANKEHLEKLNQGVKKWNKWREEDSQNPDLSSTDLTGLDLRGANFDRANLRKANLSDAKLEDASFDHANLCSAILSKLDLRRTRFHLTAFDGAELNEVQLGSADLTGSSLQGASLFLAHLFGARLIGVNFSKAKMRCADLREAKLSYASFLGADLTLANLFNADLTDANLEGANLHQAELIQTNLTRANISSAILSGSTFFADITEVNFNGKTRLRGLRLYGQPTLDHHPSFKRHLYDEIFLGQREREILSWLSTNRRTNLEAGKGIRKLCLASKYAFFQPRWGIRSLLHFLWGVTSDYGRNFKRWCATEAVIALIFGFLYSNLGFTHWFERWPDLQSWLREVGDPCIVIQSAKTWFTPWYFSVVTFTTLGFGDIRPCNLSGQLFVTLEVVIGYLMLGGMVSIFANKFARRE